MKEPSLLDDEIVGWTDDTVMPFGKHKGVKMKDLPGNYLLWCFDQADLLDNHKGLAIYIDNNLDEITEKADGEKDYFSDMHDDNRWK